MSNKEISLKGLDSFSKAFLNKTTPQDGNTEYVSIGKGQQLKPEVIAKYEETRTQDFIRRAGSFTEDLVAFVLEQKKMRTLSDVDVIFGLALANINLRESYGTAQGNEKPFTESERERLLSEFDAICGGAQEYYDANT